MTNVNDNVTQMMSVALHHHSGRRLAEAEKVYRKVIAEDPLHADAHHLLGLIMQQTGKPQEAVREIATAVALNEAEPAYYYSLGLVMADLGRGNETVACLQKAVELSPDFAEAHEALAETWRALGYSEEADSSAARAKQASRKLD